MTNTLPKINFDVDGTPRCAAPLCYGEVVYQETNQFSLQQVTETGAPFIIASGIDSDPESKVICVDCGARHQMPTNIEF